MGVSQEWTCAMQGWRGSTWLVGATWRLLRKDSQAAADS